MKEQFSIEEIEKRKAHITEFEERDGILFKELTEVFLKHGLEGRLVSVEFECGTTIPKPPIIRCFRVCIPGPDDRPICTWICV
ncbi:MAG: hypothetical protein ACTSU7_03130 [Candidatus Heimdallarchaeaceae archaeon]